jgi:cytochrome c oxidase assembly protein subunit 15
VAVLLVCATFPLIWVGGLVTTYEAGMAVPDWPNTYGYNLFFYPWQTWIMGPWDLFIEHGHRLFGAAVGMLTILLVATAYRYDLRAWYRRATLGALALVICQGVLGGMRVLLDQRLLAQIHGCVAPLFFALSVALAVWTSPRWLAGGETLRDPKRARFAASFQRLALATVLVAYLQLVLGSQLRHVRPSVDMATFRTAVWLHLFMAGVLVIHVLLLASRACWSLSGENWLRTPAIALAVLLAAQIGLGAGAWVVNYGWPAAWFSRYSWAQEFVVTQEGRTQALVTTAHVATGSLILAISLLVALRSLLLPAQARRPSGRVVAAEVLA